MKKKSCFWRVYKSLPKKDKKRFLRENFWGWMMEHLPRIYKWCDKVLPFDTLPF